MVRRVTSKQCNIWLVTSHSNDISLVLTQQGEPLAGESECVSVQVGTHCFICLITFTAKNSTFTPNQAVEYALEFTCNQQQQLWNETLPSLLYDNQSNLSFVWTDTPSTILHGSCRKPHFDGDDALAQVDSLIADVVSKQPSKLQGVRPDLLLMTGDQVYVDDVAGPMLNAIQQTIDLLGLQQESLEGAIVSHSSELASHPFCFYHRQQLLPKISTNTALSKLFFGAKKKPIFTSVNAQNHLISGAEVLAMYLLVWSPSLWPMLTLTSHQIRSEHQEKFDKEASIIRNFVASLKNVRRALAHIPVYMIFDDHDVTDDWNLTRGWEEEVYNNPLSKRMIGNALTGYLLCQGWGNAPDKCAPLIKHAKAWYSQPDANKHTRFIEQLLAFEEWDYRLDTTPPIEVLDTRTRRWRSESSMNKPSGLMDWEALCEFQHNIIGKDAVIVVSAAPIYGVKFIEAIQKVFTFFGKALTVDAENWMAHKGTANVMLNIFRHYKTPPEFIILSGDVHYSFVYDVRLRFRRNSPHITQFTCSGLKNAFPDGLIRWLDRLNRAFYGPSSILNVFTRRRNMSVSAREPTEGYGELYNGCALGVLKLSNNSRHVTCKALLSSGKEVEFPPIKDD
jgi:hypothetical protein